MSRRELWRILAGLQHQGTSVIAVGDEGFQRKCHDHIRALNQRGTTVLLVSHSLAEVQRLCHRAACMEAGWVDLVGDPHSVGLHYHRLLGIA